MGRRHPNRPPVRRCEGCGGDYCSWAIRLCDRCVAESEPDRVALVELVRERRPAVSRPAGVPVPRGQTELPEGF